MPPSPYESTADLTPFSHGCPHKDILDPTGSVVRKVWFELLDNQQGLDLAIKDLKDNYELYIERFKKWLKE